MSRRSNILLAPTELGKSRMPVSDLPPEDFVYGMKSASAKETAGDVIGGWQVHKAAQTAKPGKDFKTMNKKSVLAGNTTAKEISEFRKTHDIRFSISTASKQGGKLGGGGVPDENARFGKKNRASTPVGELLTYPESLNEMKPRISIGPEKKHIPVTHTKASLGHQAMAQLQQVLASDTSPIKGEFKMKKFLNVPAKVTQYRRPSPERGAAGGAAAAAAGGGATKQE